MNKIILIILLFVAYQAKAQDTNPTPFDWGVQPDSAKWHYALFIDDMTVKSYHHAEKSPDWLLQNTPRLHKTLYDRAKKCYGELLLDSKTNQKRLYYKQRIAEMDLLKKKYFGEK